MNQLQKNYMGVLIAANTMKSRQKDIDKIFFPPHGDEWDYDTKPSPVLAGRKECRALSEEQQAAILFDPHRLANHADMTLQAQYYNLYRNALCFRYDNALLDKDKYRPDMRETHIREQIVREAFVSQKDPVTKKETRKLNTESLKHYHAMHHCLGFILNEARETDEFSSIVNDFSNQLEAIGGFVAMGKIFLEEGLSYFFGLTMDEVTPGNKTYWQQNKLKSLYNS